MLPENSFLHINNITKTYSNTTVLQDVSFKVEQHKNVAIIGVSGSGKTSLLKILSGHLQATNGEVFFEGLKVVGPLEKLLPGHKNIGYLSQHYELLNNYVVKDLILFNEMLSLNKINELLEICAVNHLLNRKTSELSGGEKQRIALCKILITQPKLLVLDEPYSNLDLWHSTILKSTLQSLQQELGISILLASHNPLDTLSWANEIIVLQDGKIVQQANPESTFYQPKNQYVAGLFGSYTNLQTLFQLSDFCIARPNQITITSSINATLKGFIKTINFLGVYYEVIVQVGLHTCVVHVLNKPENKVNEEVGLIINTNSPYY